MYPNKDIIELADKLARKSTHRFRLGAVVYLRSYVLGTGWNDHIKTHPRSPHPYRTKHAEFSALLEAVGRNGEQSVSNSSIYIHRIKADGSPGLAKPCVWCEKMLIQADISDVHWSKDAV